jgi:hypothetical protein
MTPAPFNTYLEAFPLENDPRLRNMPYAPDSLQYEQRYLEQNSPIPGPVSAFDPMHTPCAGDGLALAMPTISTQLGLESMTKWAGEHIVPTESGNTANNWWMGFESYDLNNKQQHGSQSSTARPLRANDLKDGGAPCGCFTPSSTPRAK